MRGNSEVGSQKAEVRKRPFAADLRPLARDLRKRSSRRSRPSFTLTELLIVIAIIAILTGLGLSAYAGATNMAREMRTRSQINKIDQLIMERYEGYRTRAVPIKSAVGTNPRLAAQNRLQALRELMRLEMPDRISDLCDPVELNDLADFTLSAINSLNAKTSALTTLPSLARTYKRKALMAMKTSPSGGWTTANESSECLYLILSTMRDGDKSALDYFQSDEIGDLDHDGMNEILDGWGQPIMFIRWPAGYAEQTGPDGAWGFKGVDDDGNGITDDITEAGWPGSDDIIPKTPQTRNWKLAPDPFDPAKVDPRWSISGLFVYPYATIPLIVSSGRDKSYDLGFGVGTVYSTMTIPTDPYYPVTNTLYPQIGEIADSDGDGSYYGYVDNITNHDLKNQ